MRIVQKAIIKNADKFLCVLRSKNQKILPNIWDFPGGKLDPGETFEEGIIREVKEETNLDIIPNGILRNFVLGIQDDQFEFNIFSVENYFGNIRISAEHEEYRWLTKEEIKDYKISPFLEKLIEDGTI